MSKLKRPSFLPLSSGSSYGQSEYYVLNSKSNNCLQQNIYSPANSIESESDYSSANTPNTPTSLNTPITPNDAYLPYSTIPIQSPSNVNKDRFGSYGLQATNCYASKDLSASNSTDFEEPDWLNESVDMNESFKFYDGDEQSNDLDRTLTNQDPVNLLQSHKVNQLDINYQDHQSNLVNDLNDDEHCSMAFKELMDLAELTLIRILQKSQMNKPSGPSYSLSNPPSVYTKFCKFCKNNREPRKFYLGHSTIDDKGRITCPILQQYKCELCGSTGVNAHTRSYCPYSKMIRETMPDINDTYEFYNKKSMIHSTDSHLYDNEIDGNLSD